MSGRESGRIDVGGLRSRANDRAPETVARIDLHRVGGAFQALQEIGHEGDPAAPEDLLARVPYPLRPVGDDDWPGRVVQAPPPGLPVQPRRERPRSPPCASGRRSRRWKDTCAVPAAWRPGSPPARSGPPPRRAPAPGAGGHPARRPPRRGSRRDGSPHRSSGRNGPGDDARHPRRDRPALQPQRPARRQVSPAAGAATEIRPLYPVEVGRARGQVRRQPRKQRPELRRQRPAVRTVARQR